ncbi:MAG: hypothetical protein CMP23_00825 [Rickettsiales bacterium]|nr:hypothetical protein [Rickettsiales bacterium]|tara:strand:+ start:1213 stop:2805 length:1593 start_codon:yes stop_codon:yes gene_type:complete
MDSGNSTRSLILLVVVATVLFALLAGAGLIASKDTARIGLIYFGAVLFIGLLPRLFSLSFGQLALLGLLFLHFMNVARDMNVFAHEELFDSGRLPVSMAIALPVFIVGWRALLTGPGFAAISGPAVFLSWALLASGFGIDPAHSYFYGGWLFFMALLISVARGLHKNPEAFWETWLKGLLLMGLMTSTLSIFAIALDLPGARYERWVFNNAGTGSSAPGFCGIFGNPNTMASCGLLSMASVLAISYQRQRERSRWLELTLVICGSAVLLSGSRAAILGTGICGITYLWLIRPNNPNQMLSIQSRGTLRTFLGPAIVFVALVGFATTPTGRVGLDRLLTTEAAQIQGSVGRDEIWMSFINGLQKRPVFGHGFMTRPMKDDWETLRIMPEQAAKSAHSAPLEYGTTTGLVGLLLFLWMLSGGLRGLLRPGHKMFAQSAVVFWLCSSPIYLLFSHGNNPSAPAVWPLWVLLLTCRSINGQPQEGTPAPPWVLRISRQEEQEFRNAMPNQPITSMPPSSRRQPSAERTEKDRSS